MKLPTELKIGEHVYRIVFMSELDESHAGPIQRLLLLGLLSFLRHFLGCHYLLPPFSEIAAISVATAA